MIMKTIMTIISTYCNIIRVLTMIHCDNECVQSVSALLLRVFDNLTSFIFTYLLIPYYP